MRRYVRSRKREKRSKSEKCTCENRVPSEEDKKESTDGLYIIYEDGHAEPFTGDNSKDCVRYIGLKHRYMSFAISLTEHDIVQLLDDDSREESGSGTYYERECDALFDIDGRGNTERLVARNPKLRNLLEAFISSRPGCILCRLDEMESWAYLDDLLP